MQWTNCNSNKSEDLGDGGQSASLEDLPQYIAKVWIKTAWHLLKLSFDLVQAFALRQLFGNTFDKNERVLRFIKYSAS